MIDKNDHKLTAFALGELTETDFFEIEAEVNSSTELQVEVEAIKKIAEDITEFLASEQYVEIADDTLYKIGTKKQSAKNIKQLFLNHNFIGIASAIIIVCIIIVTIIIQNKNLNNIAIQKIIKPTDITNSQEQRIKIPAEPESSLSNDPANKQSNKNSSDELSNNSKKEQKIITTISNSGLIDIKEEEYLLGQNQMSKTAPLLDIPHNNNDASDANLISRKKPLSNSNVPILTQTDQSGNAQNIVETVNSEYSNSNQQKNISLSNSYTLNADSDSRNTNQSNKSLHADKLQQNKAEQLSARSNLQTQYKTKENKNTNETTNENFRDVNTTTLPVYEIMRQSINNGKVPSANEIKIGEYVNNFCYNYSETPNDHEFVIQTDMILCPWNKKNLLVRIGVKKSKNKISEIEPNPRNPIGNTINEKLDLDSVQNNERRRISIKFDKNKIKSYIPIANTEVKQRENENASQVNTMIEVCDIDETIRSNGEMTLLYEITPLDDNDGKTSDNKALQVISGKEELDLIKRDNNKKQKEHSVLNDYFSVELLGQNSYPVTEKMKDQNGVKSPIKIIRNNYIDNETNKLIHGETQFAAAVVLYGLLLQKGKTTENYNWNTVKSLANPNTKNDKKREEFINLIEKASKLIPQSQ
ncbi:MAG: von Willebrand factor type A domain-containing protein [Planctomycetaceae bacterium]|jgi:hypothetical protein|nr:von Willebrand factor type A domain-containing protein [Planctomycetaceae bacterium]